MKKESILKDIERNVDYAYDKGFEHGRTDALRDVEEIVNKLQEFGFDKRGFYYNKTFEELIEQLKQKLNELK